VVNDTLAELGATHIPQLVVLNKIDRLEEPELATEVLAQYPNSLAVSARTGYGVEALLNRIEGILQQSRQSSRLLIPYHRGDLVAMMYQQAIVEKETHVADGTLLEVHVPNHLLELVLPYQVKAPIS